MTPEFSQRRLRCAPVIAPRLALLLAMVLGAIAGTATGAGTGTTFQEANRLYEEGKHAQAAAAYEQLITRGHASAAAYFNLGNAQFRCGQPGRAIASYRNAALLSPRDPDIRANLNFVRRNVGTTRPTGAVWRSGLETLRLDEWAMLSLGSLWAWMACMASGQLQPPWRPRLKTWTRAAGGVTVCCGLALLLAASSAQGRTTAVVIVPEATVRNGPVDVSPSRYLAKDGTELRVGEVQPAWVEVTDGAGRRGWVSRTEVQVVPPPGPGRPGILN